jgi:cell division septal protein FtsQ
MGTPHKRKPKEQVPRSILAISAFKPMYALLKDLNEGLVSEIEGKVVVPSFSGESNHYLNAVKALDAWCSIFKLLGEATSTPVVTKALVTISATLNDDKLELYETTLMEARAELDAMYKLWMRAPTNVILHVINGELDGF